MSASERPGEPERTAAVAGGAAPSAAARCLDEGVWRTRLPDGPLVLTERLDTVRSVALGVWFRQGGVHEPPAQRGISHLLEHLVFKGTRRRSPRQLALEVEQVGGTMDAYTTHEATCFQVRVPESALEQAVDVLADLAFDPALREPDLELERGVILEELAAIEENPEELVFEEHAAFLYGGHPYGAPVIGTRESIESLDTGALRSLHAMAYRPGNAVVSAAGCVEHEQLVELIRRSFPASGGEPPGEPPPPSSPGRGTRRVQHPAGRQTHLVAGGPTVPYSDRLRYAVVLVGTALGGGMSSRLFQRIREQRGLAYSVYGFQSFYAAAGHAGAYLGTSPETAGEARELLEDELRAVADSGLDPDEIERTKEQLKGRLMIALESPAARMNRLAGLALYGEPYRTLDEIVARIDRIDEPEVARAAAFFQPERLAWVELSPGEVAPAEAVEGRQVAASHAPHHARS